MQVGEKRFPKRNRLHQKEGFYEGFSSKKNNIRNTESSIVNEGFDSRFKKGNKEKKLDHPLYTQIQLKIGSNSRKLLAKIVIYPPKVVIYLFKIVIYPLRKLFG